MSDLVLYGLAFNGCLFQRGSAFILGRFNGEPFSCVSKSGSQNLWLPFRSTTGLKVFNPKGVSGASNNRTLYEAAKTYYDSQDCLAKLNLAPKPLEMLEINLIFEKSSIPMESWNCYGVIMDRVFSGGAHQVLKNLQRLGVTIPDHSDHSYSLISECGYEALTLQEYAVICRFFGAQEDKITELQNKILHQIPQGFNIGLDLLTLANIVLDEHGEPKVVDFDYCNI